MIKSKTGNTELCGCAEELMADFACVTSAIRKAFKEHDVKNYDVLIKKAFDDGMTDDDDDDGKEGMESHIDTSATKELLKMILDYLKEDE